MKMNESYEKKPPNMTNSGNGDTKPKPNKSYGGNGLSEKKRKKRGW